MQHPNEQQKKNLTEALGFLEHYHTEHTSDTVTRFVGPVTDIYVVSDPTLKAKFFEVFPGEGKRALFNFLRFMVLSVKAYRMVDKSGTAYVGTFGVGHVCNLAIFVGVGREAWRVTRLATEAGLVK